MRYAHFAKICGKCSKVPNMRIPHIRVFLTCLTYRIFFISVFGQYVCRHNILVRFDNQPHLANIYITTLKICHEHQLEYVLQSLIE